ncbi:MAG TPA: choice-of-anchor X domain-containing protein [Thermoanaerobaculia bacterium]|nr:choice-of-anchor X domain-containing protein [Thermoanaerobaculia bacterium]
MRKSRLLVALLTCSLTASISAQTVTGRFPAGTKYEAPQENSPVATSRFSVRTVQLSSGKTTVEVPATGGGGLILWTIPLRSDVGVRTAVTRPDGATLNMNAKVAAGLLRKEFDAAELALDLPAGQHEVVHVDHASAGSYRIELESTGETGVTIVAAEPDSSLQLETWANPLSRAAGAPVTLFARLSDGAAALGGARVRASIASPSAKVRTGVELFDDGRHNDQEAGDGLYAATLNSLPADEAGFWQVRLDTEGTDSHGAGFARTGSASFMNERTGTRLVTRNVHAELIGEGDGRVLHVTVPVIARAEGNYRLDVLVAGAAGAGADRPALVWSETTENLSVGRNELVLDIPARDLRGSLLLDIRLLSLDSVGLAGRTTISVTAE